MAKTSIPGYTVKRLLGKGGMAHVYLAEQEVLERQVALKVMSKSVNEDPTFGKRFLSEAKIASRLVHPNIVTVYDMGVHEDAYYISMQYIEGHDLKKMRSELSISAKILAIKDIAKALSYAGGKGVVHRDIKPENIMLHRNDGRAVLTDFGIAKAAESDQSVTQTGMAIGTPHYMSPEQAKGKQVDPRSDIYSLGVVFYYLLTGRVPYDADSAVSIGIMHISNPVPVLPSGYEHLQSLLDRMMAKKPDERYQSAEEVVNALDAVDINILEHAVDFAKTNLQEGSPDCTTVSSDLSDPNGFDAEVDNSAQISELIETEDHVFGRRRSILGWMFICIFGSTAILAAFYYVQPEFAKPWLVKLQPYLISAWNFIDSLAVKVGIDLSPLENKLVQLFSLK